MPAAAEALAHRPHAEPRSLFLTLFFFFQGWPRRAFSGFSKTK